MSQYKSRLHIVVDDLEVWKELGKEFHKESLANDLYRCSEFSYVREESWGVSEEQLEDIVNKISKVLKNKGIVLADTTDTEATPYTYCIMYLGDDDVRTVYFPSYEIKCDMFNKIDICSIESWIFYSGTILSSQNKEMIQKCKKHIHRLFAPKKIEGDRL